MNARQVLNRNDKDRTRDASSPEVNGKIDRETAQNVDRYSMEDDDVINERIKQLDNEWDIDRVLELNAGLLGVAGTALAATVDSRWILLTGLVGSFLALHAVRGWCPPVPLLRKMGFRTRKEIDREKYTLMLVSP